jgi:hypothetical protein
LDAIKQIERRDRLRHGGAASLLWTQCSDYIRDKAYHHDWNLPLSQLEAAHENAQKTPTTFVTVGP